MWSLKTSVFFTVFISFCLFVFASFFLSFVQERRYTVDPPTPQHYPLWHDTIHAARIYILFCQSFSYSKKKKKKYYISSSTRFKFPSAQTHTHTNNNNKKQRSQTSTQCSPTHQCKRTEFETQECCTSR